MKLLKRLVASVVLLLSYGVAQAQDAYCQALEVCPQPYVIYIDDSVTNNQTYNYKTVNQTSIHNTYVTVEDDSKAMASALALSSSLVSYKEGLNLGVGIGMYRNKKSIAFSLSKVKDNFRYNISITKTNSSSFGYAAGLGVNF